MEGAGEVNGALDPSAGAHIKRKEPSGSPPAGNRRVMESSGLLISDESERHEDAASLLRSPEFPMEVTRGKALPPRHADHATDDNEMVEELTLRNFRFPHHPPPNDAVDEQAERGPWHSFYKLAVDPPRDAVAQEPEPSAPSFAHFWAPKLPPQDHSSPSGPEQAARVESARSPGAIRTKILSSSGFPQVLVKTNLKGKAVAYRCPPPAPRMAQRREPTAKEATPDAMAQSNARPLVGGGRTVDANQEESSLRSWLRRTDHRTGKSERLRVFVQILEFVEESHAKGLVLQHLGPSYFMLLPSNQVRYTGSFVSHEQVDLQEEMGNPTKRRRHCDDSSKETRDFPLLKQQRIDGYHSAAGSFNLFEVMGGMNRDMAGGQFSKDLQQGWPSFLEDAEGRRGYGFGGSFPGITCKRSVAEILQLEDKWYASPEQLRGSGCSFESNIYALGVLFFEIFCCFDSWELRAAAVSDLRHRILPSSFLSESPKEAGFCLWLLHPEPSSRPKAREALLSDLLHDSEKYMLDDQSLACLQEEDAEADLLFHFLLSVKEEKEKQADKLVKDVECLRKDLDEIDKRHSSRIAHLCTSKDSQASVSNVSDRFLYERPLHTRTVSESPTPSMHEERLMKSIGQLEHAYFSMRSEVEMQDSSAEERSDKDVLASRDRLPSMLSKEGESYFDNGTDRLGAFFDGLCKYARYNRFEVRGSLRNGDFHNSANVICSLSFDRDEEYFAAAGVTKKIKIFEYESLLNDAVDVHYPAIEMSSRSRLSCICWNGYIKNYLASTDYDGVVQLWDASTGQGFTQYTEHQKRAWSVDFSHVDPTKLASGSDDYSVKLWKINERNSTSTIRSVANVCCVQFSLDSTNLLAFGSADYRIYCFDLRNVRVPWCTLVGHKKAVSYVRFVDSETLVSASTDNTLKLWDLNKTNSNGFSTNACSLTFSGHTNEKNFIGLSVSDGYIACGSETNEVFSYYKSLPMPITSHKFGSIDPISGQETGDDNGQFVSSVCWRGKSNMVVAANSSGSVKLLQMSYAILCTFNIGCAIFNSYIMAYMNDPFSIYGKNTVYEWGGSQVARTAKAFGVFIITSVIRRSEFLKPTTVHAAIRNAEYTAERKKMVHRLT